MATSSRIRGLITAATALGAILAGGNVDRHLVQMPAWKRVGPVEWGKYSRQAELSKNGRAVEPSVSIGHALLTLAVAIGIWRRRRLSPLALPAYMAALMSIGSLLASLKAAPLSNIRKVDNEDVVAMEQTFDRCRRWGAVRGVCQILAFLGNLWSLHRVSRQAAS